MTKIINRLPAILPAVIIAAALAFVGWAGLQPAFAEDGGAIPPEDQPEIWIESEGCGIGVPGQSFEMEAILDNFPDGVEQRIMTKEIPFTWKVSDNATGYTHIDQDPDDPLMATLYIDAIPEGGKYPVWGYHAEFTLDGKLYTSNSNQFEITDAYTMLEYDNSFDEDVHDMVPGDDPVQVDMQVKSYTIDKPEGTPVPASYQWAFDPEEVTVEPAQAKSQGEPVTFKVTRLTAEDTEFSLQTSWKNERGEEDGTLQYYNMPEVSFDLEDYELDLGVKNPYLHVISEGSTVEEADLKPSVTYGTAELDAEDYTLKVEKVLGYDEETFDDIYSEDPEQNKFPLKLDTKDEDGNDAEDLNGNITTGTAVYRITAEAVQDSGYTGSTSAYLCLYSDKTLNYYGAEAEFAGADKYMKEVSGFPYFQYEVPIGTKLTMEVKGTDGTVLTEGTDYKAVYYSEKDEADSEAFPEKAGLYQVVIVGIGDYYGITAPWVDHVKIAKKNTMTVKAKSVKAKAKKKTVVKTKKAFNVKNAKGKVTYTKMSGNKKITVSKTGKVTVKKGLKKGKTYKVKVKVSTEGNASYLSAEKTVTLKVKITK